MKTEKVELTIEDLISATFAMESWLDAFSEEEEHAEDVTRVRKVLQRMSAFLKTQNNPYLRLVPKEGK